MSSPQNPASPDIPGLGPGSLSQAPKRHALGLPAGSIRALLALMVVGLLCLLILISPSMEKPIPIPVDLVFLLFLILGHFFAAHGNTISKAGSAQPPPLHLPRGTIRLALLVLLVGTIGYVYYQYPEALKEQLKRTMEQVPDQYWLPGVVLGGFILGLVLHMVVGREITPYWFEDFEAWIALLAVLGLFVLALIYFVVNPSIKEPRIPTTFQAIIAFIVAFYFGARS